MRADSFLRGKVLDDPLLKAFYQRPFATLAVFIQLGFTPSTIDFNGFGWAFFIWFCHDGALFLPEPEVDRYVRGDHHERQHGCHI